MSGFAVLYLFFSGHSAHSWAPPLIYLSQLHTLLPGPLDFIISLQTVVVLRFSAWKTNQHAPTSIASRIYYPSIYIYIRNWSLCNAIYRSRSWSLGSSLVYIRASMDTTRTTSPLHSKGPENVIRGCKLSAHQLPTFLPSLQGSLGIYPWLTDVVRLGT